MATSRNEKEVWIMSQIVNVPLTTDNEKVNINRKAIEHRATWMGLFMDEAKKAGIDLVSVARKAVGRCGSFHGVNVYKKNMKKPEDLLAFADVFANEVTLKTFDMEILERSEKKFLVHFHYCPLVSAWQKLGFSDADIELYCDIAMDGDRQIAASFDTFDFELGKTIAKGDKICEVCFLKKR